MGRETFMLPVTWTADGWPVILPKGERVPSAIKTPNNAAISLSDAIPVSGDITRHVEFKGRALTPQWVMLRAPKETWWKLNPEAGQIAITPRSELLSGTGNPSYLALRVQHSHFKASTSVEVPTESGVSAGLAFFQNDRHHYFLAVSREGDGMVVYLERAAGDRGQMAASARLPRASRMKLRVTADDAKCAFEYAADAGDWKTLAADADATQLTTEVAGGFVGATVGMHARVDGPAVVERITSTNSFAAATTYRFKAGATAAFIDTKGQVWLPDQGFEEGDTVDHDPPVAIAGTTEPGLYQSEHYSMTAFRAKIPNGSYLAKLYFAETYDGISGPGERVFSFSVQGNLFKDFDVWVKAGGPYRAYVESVPVEVTNGVFRIDFTSNVENPQINAIEIIPRN
jgi:Beta xylosidase C-terminal Concanavalin A-like domain/Malectin domain